MEHVHERDVLAELYALASSAKRPAGNRREAQRNQLKQTLRDVQRLANNARTIYPDRMVYAEIARTTGVALEPRTASDDIWATLVHVQGMVADERTSWQPLDPRASPARVRFAARDNKLALVVTGGVLAMMGPVAAAQITAGATPPPTPSVTIVQGAPRDESVVDVSALRQALAGAPPDALRQLARTLGVSSPQQLSTDQLVKQIVVEASTHPENITLATGDLPMAALLDDALSSSKGMMRLRDALEYTATSALRTFATQLHIDPSDLGRGTLVDLVCKRVSGVQAVVGLGADVVIVGPTS